MPASRAQQAIASERRAEILRRKIAGEKVTNIAAALGISRATASKDLTRACRKARDLEIQEAELYRQLQSSRLEELLTAVWPDAITGDVKASEQARKLIGDLTDLMGVKVPVRTEISGPDGGAIPFSGGELAELTALIGISDEEHADIPTFDHDADDEDEDLEDGEEDEDDDSDA